ncbi:hypothetical protein GCM10027515_00780 [Schumannella luteola]
MRGYVVASGEPSDFVVTASYNLAIDVKVPAVTNGRKRRRDIHAETRMSRDRLRRVISRSAAQP